MIKIMRKLLGLFPILLAWREHRINKLSATKPDLYSLDAALAADCDEAQEYI
jgi:hypothetical protein